jgi:hypothetical protein
VYSKESRIPNQEGSKCGWLYDFMLFIKPNFQRIIDNCKTAMQIAYQSHSAEKYAEAGCCLKGESGCPSVTCFLGDIEI